MKQARKGTSLEVRPWNGFAGWLLRRLSITRQGRTRLSVLERIQLAPRQSLVMIEADGRVLLVATSPEGSTTFFPVDELRRQPFCAGQLSLTPRSLQQRAARISW